MVSVALIGAAVTGLCAYRLPIAELDSKFVVLTLITVLIGSRISIKITGAGGQISVSDTFIFLAILLFGVEAAVLLAAFSSFFFAALQPESGCGVFQCRRHGGFDIRFSFDSAPTVSSF